MDNFLNKHQVFSLHQLIHLIIMLIEVLRYDYKKINSLQVS